MAILIRLGELVNVSSLWVLRTIHRIVIVVIWRHVGVDHRLVVVGLSILWWLLMLLLLIPASVGGRILINFIGVTPTVRISHSSLIILVFWLKVGKVRLVQALGEWIRRSETLVVGVFRVQGVGSSVAKLI